MTMTHIVASLKGTDSFTDTLYSHLYITLSVLAKASHVHCLHHNITFLYVTTIVSQLTKNWSDFL